MKKLIVILLAILPFVIKATNYTSVSGGGNWSNSSTWSPSGVPGSGDNVTIASAVTLDANESCNNITVNSSQTFSGSSNTLTVYGNFTNNGTFTYSTSMIIFGGSANQTITGTTTFYNLTIDPSGATDTTFLASAITINNNLAISQGALDLQNHIITGNATGTMTMASGTTMLCGLKTSSTQIDIPTNYTAANISFNVNSTVIFQANNTTFGQGVSAIPTYGNLIITTSNAATVFSSSTFTVAGNLTIGNNITFTEGILNAYIDGNLLINTGGKLSCGSSTVYFTGNITNYGTFNAGSSNIEFDGSSNQTIYGTGITKNIEFDGLIYHPTSTSDSLIINAPVYCYGPMSTYAGKLVVPATCNDSIIQSGSLNTSITALNGIFYWEGGSANNGTQIFNKLTIGNSGTVTLAGATCSVNSDCSILSGSTFSLATYTLTLNGNLTNNGTLTASTSTVKFDGSQNQTISGTGSISFYNLTQNQAANTDSLFLGKAITVSHNLTVSEGVLDCQANQITGNASGTFSLAANTGLVLGLTSSSTAVSFPYKFTTAHNSLNATSTVNYQANANQTISDTATYGNLILNTGVSGVNKTPNGSITLAGNLTIDNGVTLPMSSNNLTIAKSFTNNGTFTYGTGTVTFNGSANQNLNGTSTTNFYNLTENTAASTDTLFLNNPITVNNTLTITQGILDCQKNQLTNSATPVVSLSPSSATICYGNSTSLTASSYTNYLWYPSAGLSATTGSSVSASPTITTTYSVYGISGSKYTCGTSRDTVNINFCNNSCANSIALGDGCVSAIPINYSNMWYSFTASGNTVVVNIFNPRDTLHGRIVKLVLYGGTCSSLDSITSDTLIFNTIYQDSAFFFYYNKLTSGNTYYLKAVSDNVNSSREYGLCMHRANSSCPAPPACDLVSNGNFTSYNLCPPNVTGPGYIHLANCWGSPTIDDGGYYFNACASAAYNGVPTNYMGTTNSVVATDGAYAAILPYTSSSQTRYYIQQNISPMAANTTYNVSFYTQLASCSEYFVGPNIIGLFISNYQPVNTVATNPYNVVLDNSNNYIPVADPGNLITSSTLINSSALGWVQIKGTYTSTSGGEDWITIGNFNNDANTGTGTATTAYGCVVPPYAFYYIDDVSITKGVSISASATNPVCAGSSTTLGTSAGWTTYSWSTGATTSTITVSPTSTTSYSVSVSDGSGCSATATYTITTNPTPSVSVSPTSSSYCLPSGSATLTASGGSTYAWSPSTGLSATTGASVTATPTVITTYSVSSTNSYGCTGTATSVITPTVCCSATCSGAVTISSTSPVYASSLLSGSSITSACAYINTPNFIIDENFTISGCDVSISPNTQIEVQDGNTLTITGSRLYACSTMWDGILVDEGISGGEVDVMSNSIIEDAKIGIKAQATLLGDAPPTISVVDSKLNNNYYDIYIDSYNAGTEFPLTFQNSILTTSSDGAYSGPKLKSPYTNDITYAGFYLNSVDGAGIQIGDYGSGAYLNTFNDMNYGIIGNNSNFYVYNNTFENMAGKCPTCSGLIEGVGIVAVAPAFVYGTSSTYYSVTAGGALANQLNYFSNVFMGVRVNNYVFTNISFNQFSNGTDNITIGLPVGDHAIYAKIRFAETMELDNNIISNFHTGIQLDRTYITTASRSYTENILNNVIGLATFSGYPPSTMNVGILAENSAIANFAPTHIDANSVDDAANCIWIRNFADQLTTVDNNDEIRLQAIPTYASKTLTQRSGIRVESCEGSYNGTIHVNFNDNIYTNGTYLSTTAAPADTETIGINVIYSQDILEQCNTMYNVGECMRFSDNCLGQQVYSNNFLRSGFTTDQCYDGMVLWNNAILGIQGNSSQPIGEQWNEASTNYLRSVTYTEKTFTPAKNSALWLLNSSLPNYPTFADNLTTGVLTKDSYEEPGALNTVSIGSAPGCSAICSTCHRDSGKHGVLDSIALDSMHYAIYGTQAQYINQLLTFVTIANDTSYMTGDTVLRKFYNANTSGNMELMLEIQKDINGGFYSDANYLMGTFTPANTIEQNYKTADSIFTHTIGVGVDTIDSVMQVRLYKVAYQCPDMGGLAVYNARSMLNMLTSSEWEFSDSCNTSGGREGDRAIGSGNNTDTQSPFANLNAKVYPNPANSTLNIEVRLAKGEFDNICLYNSLGEKVICEQLASNVTVMSVGNLQTGIYYYRVTDEKGKLVGADKIMIIH